jgi:ABC-type transport system involved in multi-copper enzyme maturation permease subunit
MTATLTPYRSTQRPGRDGFAQLLWSEWTKFRTVRGWVIAMIGAALLTGGASLIGPLGSSGTPGPGQVPPTGPGGGAVTDTFFFAHRPLAGNGSITVRVTSVRGVPARSHGLGAQPWAKAGIIVKQSIRPGSPYAAIMVTPAHGVRMQDDFTHDTAGTPGAVSAASPRWLRLARAGSMLRGYESADSRHWILVGTADLSGLPSTVQAGLFVASPQNYQAQQVIGGISQNGAATVATGRFDHLSIRGNLPASRWSGTDIGHVPGGDGGLGAYLARGGSFTHSGGVFTITGSGDIAPSENNPDTVESSLTGAPAGLLVVIAVGALFITSEYRRGMIRTTLTASPRRGRVLAAKAIVIGAVTFVAGLAGVAVSYPIARAILRSRDIVLLPVTSFTELRAIVGTAALLAVAAVFAMAAGAVLRRSAGAITAVIVAVFLPELLALGGLPLAPAQWLLRLTPAAGFAVQQSVQYYPQVSYACQPANGCYPLTPWTGFGVLCAYAAAGLVLAVFLLRRRDA